MKTIFIAALFFWASTTVCKAQKGKHIRSKIQIVLLIDVSASMNGLLNQAKGQIWRMTNHLMDYEKNGEKPIVELALGGISKGETEESGYFRPCTPFTSDMDLLCL